MRSIIVIAHNLRSSHNVGSLLRTAEGLGVEQVYLTGYTPYPVELNDQRLPHIAQKVSKQIHKTSLNAEDTVAWKHSDDLQTILTDLQAQGYTVCAIEQAQNSIPLPLYEPTDKIALLVGREVEGIELAVLHACDTIIEIPMFGKKESFNVVQAAAMALYHCRFTSFDTDDAS
jgi:23S rRNA (guanosine2251-2'-O)-methyltransferase